MCGEPCLSQSQTAFCRCSGGGEPTEFNQWVALFELKAPFPRGQDKLYCGGKVQTSPLSLKQGLILRKVGSCSIQCASPCSSMGKAFSDGVLTP